MKTLTLILSLFACALAQAAEPMVIVHLLDHTDGKKTETRFWIDWSENWRGIAKTKIVTGEAADALIAQMEKSLMPHESPNLCGHDPIYGVEVTKKSGLRFKTSICFSCNTWVKPKKRLSIDGEHGIENELCKALRKVIELPAHMLPEAKAEK